MLKHFNMSYKTYCILMHVITGQILVTEASLDSDVKNLSSRLTALSDLQKQTMNLETRSAAVMADVLSKLAQNEMKFNILEKKQNSTFQELEHLKQELNATIKELEGSRNEVDSLKQNQNSVLLELQQLKLGHNVTVMELEIARSERQNVESELSALTAKLKSLDQNQNSTLLELQVARKDVKDIQRELQTTKGKLDVLEKDQNATKFELQVARTERNHIANELLIWKTKLDDTEQTQNVTLQELQQLLQEHTQTATDLQHSQDLVRSLQSELKNLEQSQNSTRQTMQHITGRHNMTVSQVEQSHHQIKGLVNEVFTLKANLSSELQHIAELESEITSPSQIAALIRGVTNVEKQMTFLQHNVSVSLSQDHSPKVYFEAQSLPSAITIQGNQRLRFSTVVLNQGNAYDKSSGVFKAPVTGLYAFWVSVVHGSVHMNIGLFIDGIQVYQEDADLGRTYFSYLAKVDKGQKIWFTKTDDVSTVLSAFTSSHYGGVLLTAV